MIEIVSGIAVVFVVLVIVLCLLSRTETFMDWMIKKDDPEWWSAYQELQSEICRAKYGNKKWGCS